MKKIFTTCAIVLTIAACAPGGDSGSSSLPPSGAFLIQSPAQYRAGQALCATGTDAYDAVVDLIDTENAALANDRALILATLDANPSSDVPGVSTFSATANGETLSITVTTDGEGAFVYDGTLTDDEGEHDYLTGSMVEDGKQGTLSITPVTGDDLQVTWSDSADGLRFVRSVGSRTTTVGESDTDVRIVQDGKVIWWSLEDFAGVVVDGGGLPQCFLAGDSDSDFCDADCTPELIAEITN